VKRLGDIRAIFERMFEALAEPRFTIVGGPLPATDPDEAAEKLVRAALREARSIGADSFHVESTARGAEMSFRVDGVRTPAALLTPDWADACARSLLGLAGAPPGSEQGSAAFELEGDVLELDVATLQGFHGRCARASLRAALVPIAIDHLPVSVDDRVSVQTWLASSGLLLVVGPSRAGCDALASELAARAAHAGRRVYRLGVMAEPEAGIIEVARRSDGDCAGDLRAIDR